MITESDLKQSRETAKEALKQFGVRLEQLKPFKSDMRPVETAFEIREIPLSKDGSLDEKLAQVLELVITPSEYVYNMTIRYSPGNGARCPDSQSIAERKPGTSLTKVPANVKRAIEIGVEDAKETDERSAEGFGTVDVSCFPYEWKWGKNSGESIL